MSTEEIRCKHCNKVLSKGEVRMGGIDDEDPYCNDCYERGNRCEDCGAMKGYLEDCDDDCRCDECYENRSHANW